ncbi:MAG: peptidyl-prolyl cis-trans isomerase [Victivallaceae bacterium]|nr:peptidyl-prolyl cis-trans isomerase [Victivallaceae bacterium]
MTGKFFVRLFFLFAASLTAADFSLREKDGQMDSILASVNGDPISLQDVFALTRTKEYQLYGAYSGEELEKQILKLRREAVDMLIDRKLMIADYHKGDYKIPNRDIESELDQAADDLGARSRAELAEKLQKSGSSIADFRRDLEEHMFVQLMLFRQYNLHVTVSPRDVHDYYRNHPDEFVRPETLTLAMIMLDPERQDMDAAVRDIETILSRDVSRFGELARRYSSGPGGNNDGKIGTIERSRLRPEFAEALTDPAAGKWYGPVKTSDGIAFLLVEDRQNAAETKFETAAPAIRAKLEREMRAEVKKRYVESLRREAVIRYFFPE